MVRYDCCVGGCCCCGAGVGFGLALGAAEGCWASASEQPAVNAMRVRKRKGDFMGRRVTLNGAASVVEV